MGKVGSRTITNTLEARYRAFHGHTSSDFFTSLRFYSRADDGRLNGETLDIITATRDPIGREISAFFQNITDMSHSWGVGSREEVLALGVDELIGKFFERWEAGAINTTVWFDRHFKPATGMPHL